MPTLLAFALLLIFILNVYATLRLYLSPLFEPRQKWPQLGMVWLLPVLGALLVIHFCREPRPGRDSAAYSADYGVDSGDLGLGSFSSSDCSAGDSGGSCGGGDGGGGGD